MAELGYCPFSGTQGRKLDGVTVKSMLSISLQNVHNTSYYFCREPNCDVVYFSEDGQQVFRTHEIRERVYQKEAHNSDVPICYCFRYTPADVERDVHDTSGTQVIEAIKQGIREEQCACDLRNPQGDCCLGNVIALAKQMSKGS